MVKIGSSNWLVTRFFYFFPLWSADKYCVCHGQFTLLVGCSYFMWWYVCLYRRFHCAVISFKFRFFSSILPSVLSISTTQVADALDITHIKCTKLKDCHHLDLFSDTIKVRKISTSSHSALAICANYLLETRRSFLEIAIMSVSNFLGVGSNLVLHLYCLWTHFDTLYLR
jgi:hypothetical protein